MVMDSPERVSSKMQPEYVALEYCFILMSLYWMFSGFDFLVLCLLPNQIDFDQIMTRTRPEYLSCTSNRFLYLKVFSNF